MSRFLMSAPGRWLILSHRWIGVAGCLLFALWFVSGAVMMYVRYPALTEAERVALSPPLDWARVHVSPESAAAASGLTEPTEPMLRSLAGEPVYGFRQGRRRAVVSAVDGRRIRGLDGDQAVAVARAAYPAARPALLRTLERDQWTVTSRYDGWRPLHLVSLGDRAGTQLYVASTTGEIILDTTRRERIWNWVGAVPHWLYFTQLRANPSAWTSVVVWTSGFGIAVAVTGIVLGFMRLRIRRRYARGVVTPYRGWMRWHHLIGVVGGAATLAWVFSGWVSMNPGGLGAGGVDLKVAEARWAGPSREPFDLAAIVHAAPTAREAAFVHLNGAPQVLLRNGEGTRLRDGRSGRPVDLGQAALVDHARGLLPTATLSRASWLTREDAYWYGHHREVALPVLRVEFDDAARTWFHIDPATGRIAGASDLNTRSHRWTFAALHRLDLPGLRARPLRDVVLLVLLGLGLAISLTGIVLAWRRLGHDLRRRRPRTSGEG